jgi:heavy metal sensor kinase
MRRWPTSLRSRLTLWYSLMLGAPLVAFALICYFVFARTLQNRTDRFIGDALTAFAREVGAERRLATSPTQAMRTTVDEVHFRDLQIVILDASGAMVAASGVPSEAGRPRPLPDSAALLRAIRGTAAGGTTAATLQRGRAAYRVVARPLEVEGARFRLSGVYPLDDVEAVLERIRRMFLLVIPLFIVGAAAGGWVLAQRSFAPVSDMASRAAEISATTLHERLPVGGGDELVGLARVVNDLLDRLEASFSQQRRFMADASHELRTPTAILRTEADVTLSREHRSEEEYRTSVAIMQDASRRLNRIVDDLFLLARADAGHLLAHREPLYLEELVHDVVRGVRQLAERRQVRVELREVVDASVEGDADLLGRLLLNLLDNAIKFSPPGGVVEVVMGRRDGRCEIGVIDQGPGIPEEAAVRIFERFFRGDLARSRAGAADSGSSGAGLGLAIARRIAELHGGRLALASSRPGRTEFRFAIPVGASTEPAASDTHRPGV